MATTILTIPPEILTEIFERLITGSDAVEPLSLVCKSFQQSYDPVVYRRVVLKSPEAIQKFAWTVASVESPSRCFFASLVIDLVLMFPSAEDFEDEGSPKRYLPIDETNAILQSCENIEWLRFWISYVFASDLAYDAEWTAYIGSLLASPSASSTDLSRPARPLKFALTMNVETLAKWLQRSPSLPALPDAEVLPRSLLADSWQSVTHLHLTSEYFGQHTQLPFRQLSHVKLFREWENRDGLPEASIFWPSLPDLLALELGRFPSSSSTLHIFIWSMSMGWMTEVEEETFRSETADYTNVLGTLEALTSPSVLLDVTPVISDVVERDKQMPHRNLFIPEVDYFSESITRLRPQARDIWDIAEEIVGRRNV